MENELYIGKEVAYYGAVVEAWVNTKMERDKSLLTLSGGGIALLGTVATTIGVRGIPQIVAIIAGFGGFLVCAVAAVAAFHWNGDYLAREIARAPRDPTANTPKRLRAADWAMFAGFTAGLLGTVVLGLLLALVPRDGARESTDKSTRSPHTHQATCCSCCGGPPTGAANRDSTVHNSGVGGNPPRSMRPASSANERSLGRNCRKSKCTGSLDSSTDSAAGRGGRATPARRGGNGPPPVRSPNADSLTEYQDTRPLSMSGSASHSVHGPIHR